MFLFGYTKEALKFLMQLFSPLHEENIPVNELFCQSLLLQKCWQGSGTDAGHWSCLIYFSCLKTFFFSLLQWELDFKLKKSFSRKVSAFSGSFLIFIKGPQTFKYQKSDVQRKKKNYLRKKMFSLEILMKAFLLKKKIKNDHRN